MTPRGYGRSSYFLYECFARGALPIYVYDDEPWLPYVLPVDRVHTDEITHFLRRRLAVPESIQTLAARRNEARALAASSFSFEGVFRDVGAFFRGDGPLTCRNRPWTTPGGLRSPVSGKAPFREVVVDVGGSRIARWFHHEAAEAAARRFAGEHDLTEAPGLADALQRDRARRPDVTLANCATLDECRAAAAAAAAPAACVQKAPGRLLELPEGTRSVILNVGSSLEPALPAPGADGILAVAFEPLIDVATRIPFSSNLRVVAAAISSRDGRAENLARRS